MIQPPASPLGSRALAAYAAPQLALAALYFPVLVYLNDFYAETHGLPLAALGAALIAARFIDGLSDPLMGLVSDRLRTRFGRRKLWLVIATPLVCLSVWMAMRPPEDVDVSYFATWLIALTLSWTVALTPYQAWGGELATDYAGRARVTAWREAAFLIGTLTAAILYSTAGSAEEGLARIALVVVIALPIFTLTALVGAPEPVDRSQVKTARGGWRLIARNAPFKRVLAAQFISSAANALPAALFLFFANDVLGVDDQTAGLLLVIYFLTAVASAPLWSFVAARAPKHRAWGWAMVASCGIFAFVPFLGEGDVVAFAVICALTGIAFGADIVLPPAIQADVVDVDTAESGEQRTGVYFAFWSVATKAAQGVAGAAAFFTLDAVGFSKIAESPPEALLTLSLLYAAAPICLKLIAVAMMWRFPLDRAAQEALKARIDAAGAPAPAATPSR